MPRARRIPKCELRPVWTQRRTADEVVLDLPLCPSTNALYANMPGRGRIKTREYRAWLKLALTLGNVQHPARIVGQADVVVATPPFRGDTDGRLKAFLDAAKAIGVIADDGERYLRHQYLIRGERPVGADARLTFTRVREDTSADLAEAA